MGGQGAKTEYDESQAEEEDKDSQIIIEFLYQKSKALLLNYLLPLYLLQGIIFVLSIIF